jgi:hypothetical protein
VRGVTERDLQDAVIQCARLLGWRVAHFRPALTAHGWRTPVEADGAGFPDLVLVRDGWVVFAELKSARGARPIEQADWLEALRECERTNDRVLVLLLMPRHWVSGEVEQLLRDPASMSEAA